MKQTACLLATFVLTSCYAMVGTKRGIPPDAATTCAGFCREMGLELGSVVVMADNIGCVCNPKGAPVATLGRSANAAALAGLATIVQEQQEEDEKRADTQRRQRY